MVSKNELLFDYLLDNPIFTIRDLIIYNPKEPNKPCFNCGHSAVRNLKRFIKDKGYVLQEKWIGNHDHKEFKLIPKEGQLNLDLAV